MFKKRGISPLIATILLIAFTVSTAYVVSQWTMKVTKKTTTTFEEYTTKSYLCDSIAIGIITCDDNDVNKYIINITNRGDLTINKTTIRISNGQTQDDSLGLKPTESNLIKINNDNDIIDIVPFVSEKNKLYGCLNKKHIFSREELEEVCEE